jgi:DNA-binding transcriptional LysR family regulator
MNLKHLQHLVLLADTLSFSRAAERAHLSQTAFSRSIQTLEADLGMRLFDRGTRTVQPTTTGAQVIARARALLAQADDLARDVKLLAHGEGGTLRLGASLLATGGVLRGMLPRLRALSPGLHIHVEVSQWALLLSHLAQDNIEFFIAYPDTLTHNPDYTVTLLPPEPASVYCRAGHPLLAQPRIQAAQLLDYPWAAVQLSEAIAASLRPLFSAPPHRALPLALSCDNLELLREAALTSDTLLCTWSTWLQADLAAGTLVDLGHLIHPTLPHEALQLPCAVVQKAGRTPSPAAQRLIGLLVGSAAIQSTQAPQKQ